MKWCSHKYFEIRKEYVKKFCCFILILNCCVYADGFEEAMDQVHVVFS